MKKFILVVVVVMMSGAVYAQQQSKKSPQQKLVHQSMTKSNKAQLKMEVRSAATANFDLNTRYWLESIRKKVYGFQKKATGGC